MMRLLSNCVLLAVLVCSVSFLTCRAQSPMYAPCTYTSADGSYFDLSPLTSYNGAQDRVMADAAGNSYIINVCPSRCFVAFTCHRLTPKSLYSLFLGLRRRHGRARRMRRFRKDCPRPCIPGSSKLPPNYSAAALTLRRSHKKTTATGLAS